MKGTLVLFGAILVGNYIADEFLIRAGEGDSGFVDASDGFGADEIVKALTIVAVAYGAKKLLKVG